VITVAAPQSLVVAQLAPQLEAPLTTKQDIRRREKKCRKNSIVGGNEIEKISKQKLLSGP
jgi:hypothetical protein